MPAKLRLRSDLLLLLSLVLVILLNPALDHGDWRRLVLAAVTLLSIIFATIMLSQIRSRLWPALVLMVAVVVFAVANDIFANRVVSGIRWGLLGAFFALSAASLFSYIKNAPSITQTHLFTAMSIFLLIGFTWSALYSAINVFYPGSFQIGGRPIDHQAELLYFSLVTLSTVGYGDVLPVSGEARMLAALEAVNGVLYIAITVAVLVSNFRRRPSD
jgi:hypothetical protein